MYGGKSVILACAKAEAAQILSKIINSNLDTKLKVNHSDFIGDELKWDKTVGRSFSITPIKIKLSSMQMTPNLEIPGMIRKQNFILWQLI